MSNMFIMTAEGTGTDNSFGNLTGDYTYPEYCDCDERCNRCGKRKKFTLPYEVTC